MNDILTPQDVYAHFDCSRPDNESLSRRVYKATECGAWAKMVEEDEVEWKNETWSCDYRKVDVLWVLHELRAPSGDVVALADAPKDVRDYFWPADALSAEGLQEGLCDAFGDVGSHTAVESLRVGYPRGMRWVFIVGSIVEGTDAEVAPERVALPCTGAALDAAVAAVEAGAEEIWSQTHGCDECGGEEVDPDCPACGGDGAVI
jgi:hypothetical protein